MKAAKVSELKASLSKYLARVKRGEEVLVTERGKPIAKLVPITPAEDEDSEWARLREMERQGLVRIGSRDPLPPDFWDRPLPADREGLALKYLLEERDSGW